MSAIKTSRTSPRAVYSHLTIESDQKDYIIDQLKKEVPHLKKNETEFYKLEDDYKALEHKYRLLMDEKVFFQKQSRESATPISEIDTK